MNRRTLLAAVTLSLSILGTTLTTGSAFAAGDCRLPDHYVLPEPTQFPEGIAVEERAGRYFITSSSNGAVLRGDLRQGKATLFLAPGEDGHTSGTGLDVDRQGRLWTATGNAGRVYVHDADGGKQLAKYQLLPTGSFVNDLAITRGGVFVTDSFNPILWRIVPGAAAAEQWLDLNTTPIGNQPGFNLNGIEATPNGRFLITVQSNVGKLWRIDTRTKQVRQIDLGAESVPNGDGLFLRGDRLWVDQNRKAVITKIKLSEGLTKGVVESRTTHPSFRFPTTIDAFGDRLVVVNSQFDKRDSGLQPELPFTVSVIPLP